ncbi:hypothetical protein [Massilia litorea]|uniref:Uncharacterized protein n=1 Tax=Massilia litorea TaxID=2769491 RepID=A0A7L9U7Q0_9BURK|nr:hypothetical protein [Massilia litorea]QOL50479.1 hypothetical protein LPB04_03985 [Massilia litorea]
METIPGLRRSGPVRPGNTEASDERGGAVCFHVRPGRQREHVAARCLVRRTALTGLSRRNSKGKRHVRTCKSGSKQFVQRMLCSAAVVKNRRQGVSHGVLPVASLEAAVADDSGGVTRSCLRFPVKIFVPYLVLPASREL